MRSIPSIFLHSVQASSTHSQVAHSFYSTTSGYHSKYIQHHSQLIKYEATLSRPTRPIFFFCSISPCISHPWSNSRLQDHTNYFISPLNWNRYKTFLRKPVTSPNGPFQSSPLRPIWNHTWNHPIWNHRLLWRHGNYKPLFAHHLCKTPTGGGLWRIQNKYFPHLHRHRQSPFFSITHVLPLKLVIITKTTPSTFLQLFFCTHLCTELVNFTSSSSS